MGILGNVEMQSPIRSSKGDVVELRGTVAIGATGAPTLTGSPGILTFTRASAGTYDITFDTFPASALAILEVGINKSAAATVANVRNAAFAPTSGTGQIVTFLNTAGTPVDPANGDELWIRISGSINP